MHELSLAEGICRAIVERVGRKPLRTIRLEVGLLAGVMVESLEFCLGEVARLENLGTPAVEIRRIVPRMRCACGREYETEDLLTACPECASFERELLAGTELTVTSVDIVGHGSGSAGKRGRGP